MLWMVSTEKCIDGKSKFYLTHQQKLKLLMQKVAKSGFSKPLELDGLVCSLLFWQDFWDLFQSLFGFGFFFLFSSKTK